MFDNLICFSSSSMQPNRTSLTTSGAPMQPPSYRATFVAPGVTAALLYLGDEAPAPGELWKSFPSPPEQGLCVYHCSHPKPLCKSTSPLVTQEARRLCDKLDGKMWGIGRKRKDLHSGPWAGIFQFCCHSSLVVSSHPPESGSPLENYRRGNWAAFGSKSL